MNVQRVVTSAAAAMRATANPCQSALTIRAPNDAASCAVRSSERAS